jgi:class 3 adenylate cyclase
VARRTRLEAGFCHACGSGAEAPAAERKQVTVLFADVAGSMDLASKMDPEEWGGLMERFFAILRQGVNRFDGRIDKFTGDGVMALFGAPWLTRTTPGGPAHPPSVCATNRASRGPGRSKS